jgi:uncharacterized protein
MQLALFPLGAVLFPQGMLSLKVFEARYLDLMSACLKAQTSFGIVFIERGSDIRSKDEAPLTASIGCSAEIIACDIPQQGLMHVQVRGLERFSISSTQSGPNGLLIGDVQAVVADPKEAVPAKHAAAVDALKQFVAALQLKGQSPPFAAPFLFEDAGWVANRWCEILPIPGVLKQRLMELPNPQTRLDLIGGFLEKQGIIKAQN